jgi:biopolymer transport protein ExbB
VYHNLKISDLKENVRAAIRAGNIETSKAFLESHTRRRTAARVLLTLVKRATLQEHRLEKVVEASAMTNLSSLESGFNVLTAMASLAPLTGFLGTVTGMIGAFRSIAEAVDVNAQIVANGIYEALITTVFGLIIAIVAMSAHSIFTNVVDKFAGELGTTCDSLIIELSERRANAGAAANGAVANIGEGSTSEN